MDTKNLLYFPEKGWAIKIIRGEQIFETKYFAHEEAIKIRDTALNLIFGEQYKQLHEFYIQLCLSVFHKDITTDFNMSLGVITPIISGQYKYVSGFKYSLQHIGLENQKAWAVNFTLNNKVYYIELVEYTNGTIHYHIERKEKLIGDSRLTKNIFFNNFEDANKAALRKIFSLYE
jgi:hypothetical protein